MEGFYTVLQRYGARRYKRLSSPSSLQTKTIGSILQLRPSCLSLPICRQPRYGVPLQVLFYNPSQPSLVHSQKEKRNHTEAQSQSSHWYRQNRSSLFLQFEIGLREG